MIASQSAAQGPTNVCTTWQSSLSEYCSRLGVSLKKKVESPATFLEFLGVTLHTSQMEARLSEEKVRALVSASDKWQVRRRCWKRDPRL